MVLSATIKTFAVLVALSCLSTAIAQQPDLAKMAEMQAKYLALAQPGDEHARLESLVGKWHQHFKMWMGPDSEPIESDGMAENEMILGGRFLMMNSSSEFGGMKAHAMQIVGYDRRHEQYTIAGFDNMGTYYVTGEGEFRDSTQSIHMCGEDEDPIMGFTQEYEFIIRFDGDSTFVFEVVFFDEVMSHGTGEFKMLEITHKRAR